MAALSKNWITEKHIDFEYKKYILLAYLSEVSSEFESNKLYPSLADLIDHYKQLAYIRDNKNNLANAFPQRLSKFDFEGFKLSYEKIVEDDDLMAEIETIINYSIPKFEYYLSEGKKIYDLIEEQLHVSPVGLIPLYPNEGYVFLSDSKNADTNVYEYHISLFEQPDAVYRGINTQYICTYKRSFSCTYESIKNDLLRLNKKLPNPATYAIESDLSLPIEETFLPIAKRTLVKYIANKKQ